LEAAHKPRPVFKLCAQTQYPKQMYFMVPVLVLPRRFSFRQLGCPTSRFLCEKSEGARGENRNVSQQRRDMVHPSDLSITVSSNKAQRILI
jgi:hypothetical protein